MPGLKDRLIAQIRASRPLSVADYMAACLLDPTDGYYTTRPPFGAEGDFITAPDISQMFGELLELCLAQAWVDQGQPTPFVLAELGPGRGTLMADVVRTARAVPGFCDAAQIVLVEASPALQAVQRATLVGQQVTWVTSVGDIPSGPLFVLANEFFDALPVRQFERTKSGWSERVVGIANGALIFGRAPDLPVAALDHRLGDTNPGDIVETCAPARAVATEIGARIASAGGIAIAIDYGDWRSRGDTLQAMRNHAYTDPLADPGQADLTAHVDFEALRRAFAPAQTSVMVPQGVLLARLGIVERAEALAQSLDGNAAEQHHAAFHRLTSADEMGTLFKAMAAYPDGAPCPAGFTA